jgi:starvation-inducible DNA-binding protein
MRLHNGAMNGKKMLADELKKLLATQYAFVIKSQFFHWNVEGPDFAQLHKFFGKIYEDVYDALDPTAEYIRILDEYTPGSFERFRELSLIQCQTKVPRARLMLQELLDDCEIIINSLNQAFQIADTENQQGIADFLASRIDAMGKHRWMLRSFLKEQRA